MQTGRHRHKKRRQMDIILLNGTERRLYELIAPLVMNPAIIRQNNGYPFKTSKDFIWYVAIENGTIEGFMPLKKSQGGMLIDNYYISGDSGQTIGSLLERIVADAGEDATLRATVFKRHVDAFKKYGFQTVLEWKKYDKMIFDGTKEDKDDETAERV